MIGRIIPTPLVDKSDVVEFTEVTVETIRPFTEGDTFTAFRNHTQRVLQEIQELDNEYVLKASPAQLEDYYENEVTVHPLVLYRDDLYISDQKSTNLDRPHPFAESERIRISATCIDISVPFEGDPVLWRVRPSTFTLSGYPQITVDEKRIIIQLNVEDQSADSETIRAQIDQTLDSLESAVNNLRQDVEKHNASAIPKVTKTLSEKRQRAQNVAGAVSSLNIPMRRRDQPLTYTLPTKRRRTPVKKPPAESETFKQEPVLHAQEYDHILNVMSSMAQVIERNPASFSNLDEESIRDHFLLQLNGHYEGAATGETFNASGKTDILIRTGGKNVFVAECKFWRGPKAFGEAIDQLLGYLTWRDAKCALLIFNKRKNSTTVLEKMHEMITARTEYVRTIRDYPQDGAQYIFVKPSEPGREIIVTTQLYDIPVETG